MQKKIVSLALVFAMVLSMSTSALAAAPRLGPTRGCTVALNFSGTTANCNVSIDGKTSTNKIEATTKLQKLDGNTYTTVKTWSETVYEDEYTLDESYTNCVKGGSYRLAVTATVYTSSGQSETVSSHSTATC